MGAFSGLRDAARGFSSNPLRTGRYVARIDSCDSFEAEQKGLMWKNTLTILAVEDGGEQPHKVGEQVHVFFKRGQYPKVFLQNIKSFMAGVLDVADEEIGEEEADAALSDDSPMIGLVTVVTGRQQASKSSRDDDGNPFKYTVYSWSPSLTDEEILEAIGQEGVERFFPNGL
jgi:hypothetical protein